MLSRLYVQNFALIEETELHFRQGLNLFTGETGAGKSLLIGAIGLILGHRADPSVILDAGKKCIVEAEFVLPENHSLDPLFEEHAIELEEQTLLIRRMILPSGKSRAFINDQPVQLKALQAISSQTVALHGQHQGQQLLETARQRQMLDAYAGCEARVKAFGERFRQWKQQREELERLRAQESTAQQQLDYYQYQLNELQEAALDPDEEAALENEFQVLEHAEEIKRVLYQQYELLYESETAVESQLAEAERSLDRYSSLEERIAEELEKVQQARYLVEDAAGQLNRLADTISDDPERLQEIQQRLDLYNRLKIKYGVQNAADLLAIQRDFEQKVQQFSSISDQIQELERAVQAEEARLAEEAQAIEAERLAGADRLQSQVEEALQAVALQGATFQVHVKRAKAEAQQPALTLDREPVRLHPHGVNTVQFLISTNEGFAPEPLAKVASGGEISRVMLAIKTALAEKLQLAVLIFDEIDTGISGEVALRVGRVMERLAEHHQLITITHLPQIASCHGRHFVIYKASHEGQVVSDVRQLSPQERVHEIAKIMSGEQPSAAAHESAKELLNQSRQQLSS